MKIVFTLYNRVWHFEASSCSTHRSMEKVEQEGMHPYHALCFQHLEFGARVMDGISVTGPMPIENCPYISFCDKAEFTCDGVKNTPNSHF
jgi:hypothetical protein